MSNDRLLAIALLALCAVARVTKQLLDFHLPDVSLTAFFVIGYAALSSRVLVLMLLTVCGLDGIVFALKAGGACISPSYPLVVPAFLVMWGAGRIARPRSIGVAVGWYLLACVVSFAINSGGYYVLSGYLPDPTFAGFLPRIATYLPDHMLRNGVFGLAGILYVQAMRARNAHATA
jgi:hypothetical protein